MKRRPILIVGLPRSGTTWIARILGCAPQTRLVIEPDNEKVSLNAWVRKRHTHRFPYLSPSAQDDKLERLWQHALSGGGRSFVEEILRRSTLGWRKAEVEEDIAERCGYCTIPFPTNVDGRRYDIRTLRQMIRTALDGALMAGMVVCRPAWKHQRIIVKSVHATLCLDWIDNHFETEVVVVHRNPFSIFSSQKRLSLKDRFRNVLAQTTIADLWNGWDRPSSAFTASYDDLIAQQVCLMMKALELQSKQHKDWIVVSHDNLCADPIHGFRDLFQVLGLVWDETAVKTLHELDAEGNGFTQSRLTAAQPRTWEKELTAAEISIVEKWVNTFSLEDPLNWGSRMIV